MSTYTRELPKLTKEHFGSYGIGELWHDLKPRRELWIYFKKGIRTSSCITQEPPKYGYIRPYRIDRDGETFDEEEVQTMLSDVATIEGKVLYIDIRTPIPKNFQKGHD